MDDQEFRQRAHQLADWMAEYIATVGDRRIVPEVAPGALKAALPERAPEGPEAFDAIFADFEARVLPGMTHWNHPGWFGYFPANHSPPSILAEMLVAAMGAQCMSWQTSPAATELEQVVMRWLADLLGLGGAFTGVIQDTASTSTFAAIVSARERALNALGVDADPRARGAAMGSFTLYVSSEAHSSVLKGARMAGFCDAQVRAVPLTAPAPGALHPHSVDPAALDAMIRADLADGWRPLFVAATIGTTSTTGVDPVDAIAGVCAEHGLWLHVDAAYAGACALLDECRHHFAGWERADSIVVNPHKWLFVNFDCSAYFVRDPDDLLAAFSMTPEYLRTRHDAEVVNFRDWGPQLGRRFRALKLWFVLRAYGAEGVRALLRAHNRMAAELADWVDAHPKLARVAPTPFALVCFRWAPDGVPDDDADALNAELMRRVNARGDVFMTHTRVGGRYTLRASVGQWRTGDADVLRLRDHLDEVLVELEAGR
jgi:aromatic-L-amino-acid decarboxylase